MWAPWAQQRWNISLSLSNPNCSYLKPLFSYFRFTLLHHHQPWHLEATAHNENRVVLCGLCYRKSKDIRKINQNHLLQLQTLVDSRYSLSDARFQTVLCSGCARILAAHTKDPENPERGRKLLKPKYDNLIPPPVHHTRLSVRWQESLSESDTMSPTPLRCCWRSTGHCYFLTLPIQLPR